jgi:pyruvate formate-lyase activating enzyme-like uncharacterized protein
MNPKPDSFGAFSVGAKRQACIDCLKGQKMVIFITGVCNKHCFYCPVSEQKMYNDTQMANERPLRHGHELKDLLSEAHAMDATGASITGGDPLTKVDRCVEYIRALKKRIRQTIPYPLVHLGHVRHRGERQAPRGRGPR